MKKLSQPINANNGHKASFFEKYAQRTLIIDKNKEIIFTQALEIIRHQEQSIFYPLVGEIFSLLEFNSNVTRAGDTNNRSDAYIVDPLHSIPIEIKSPTEILYINNKSIRQAIENKVILLSRRFYPTKESVTSLAIGYEYPADRSGVYDLIDDAYNTYGFNIGIISISDLLELVWNKLVLKREIDKTRITFLKGQL